MSIVWVAREWFNNKDVAIHYVEKPSYGEPDFYRQTVSFNAFSDRGAAIFSEKLRNRQPTGRHFYWSSKEEYENELKIMASLNFRVRGLPVYNHKGMWEFYKAIGYDYKKKRYV